MGDFFVWTFRDVLSAIGTGIVFLLILAMSFRSFLTWVKRKRCDHKNIRENGSCDAICSDCGKNLGFIGVCREKNNH